MQPLVQNAAGKVTVGPVLDSAGAVYTGMTTADFDVWFQDASSSVLLSTLSGATVAGNARGVYRISFALGNLSVAGNLDMASAKTGYTMGIARFHVEPAANYAALWTTAPGAAGGLLDYATFNTRVSTALAFTGSLVQVDVTKVLTAAPTGYTPADIAAGINAAGVVLASDGLDAVVVETGINARQALSLTLAVSTGVLLGAGTGTIIIKGCGTAITRITAACDNAGNRTAVTPTPPA